MSRQRGHRPRPAPERRAVVEKYSRRSARAVPVGSAPTGSGRSGSRSRWTAIMAGTFASIVLYALVASALVEAADGTRGRAGWLAAAAAALVPVRLFLLGLLTGAETPWRTALLVSPAVVGLFLVGALASRDIATAYVLAVGAGASFAVRIDPDTHRRRWRLWTMVGLAIYTKATYLISPSIAVVAAPMLPIIGIAIVDSVAERRQAS